MLGTPLVPAVPVERPFEGGLRERQVAPHEAVRRPGKHVGETLRHYRHQIGGAEHLRDDQPVRHVRRHPPSMA